MKRIAINGAGRTGRVMLRQYVSQSNSAFEIVAINDLTAADDIAYLIKYDSVHGRAPFTVAVDGDVLILGERRIKVCNEPQPEKLPWRALGVNAVIESTGQFTRRADAARHLQAGAQRVLIGAPSPDADLTIVLGVNEQQFDPAQHSIVSNASCTTNSLAPPVKVLMDQFGVDSVLATTVHSYTASQGLLDRPAKKKHRGRAAALSLIPTSTGADAATAQVIPALKGKIRAQAIRAPVPDGAITDITAVLTRPATAEQVNAAMAAAANGAMRGILSYSEDELVSADILGDLHSGIVHARATLVANGRMAKLLVWYDNECGYAQRCLDVMARLPF